MERKAEVLEPPGNANDGDAEQETERQMQDSYLPPAQKNPDEVHDYRYAPRLTRAELHIMPERPQDVRAQLKQLHPEGYADNSQAHQQPHHII